MVVAGFLSFGVEGGRRVENKDETMNGNQNISDKSGPWRF
jgi:hypothetical protein